MQVGRSGDSNRMQRWITVGQWLTWLTCGALAMTGLLSWGVAAFVSSSAGVVRLTAINLLRRRRPQKAQPRSE